MLTLNLKAVTGTILLTLLLISALSLYISERRQQERQMGKQRQIKREQQRSEPQ